MTRPSQNFGIAVAGLRKSMQDGSATWQNDTRKPKLTVDLDREEPHLQIIERPGGTKWVMDASQQIYNEENIFVMRHKMPFPPKFLVYFYAVDATDAELIGSYSQGTAFMAFSGVLFSEGVFGHVDEEFFYIKHFAETYGEWPDPITTNGDDYVWRIKFEIFNQPALWLGDKGY